MTGMSSLSAVSREPADSWGHVTGGQQGRAGRHRESGVGADQLQMFLLREQGPCTILGMASRDRM